MQVSLRGKRVSLRAVGEGDLQTLFRWRNDGESLYLWSPERHVVSWREFIDESQGDLTADCHVQLMVESNDGVVIGCVFSYSPQFVDGHVFVGTYLDQTRRGRGYGVEATALFVSYLFSYFNFRKIYFDVYAYNRRSITPLQKVGLAEEEGRFRKHRFWDGRYYDLVRFAVYRDKVKEIQRLAEDSGAQRKKRRRQERR